MLALRRYWPAFVAVIVVAAAILRAVDPNKTLLGWDIDGSFLNASLAFHRSLSGWTFYQALGANNAPFAAQIPLFATEAALEHLGFSPAATQWSITGAMLLLLPIAMAAYTSIVFPNRPALTLIASLAIVFNLYVAVSNNSTPYLHFNAAMAAGPLLAACILSLARSITLPKAIAFIASLLATSIMGANAAGSMVAFAMVALFSAYGLAACHIPVRKAVLPLLIFVGFSAFWLLPTAQYFISDGSAVAKSEYAVRWGESTLQSISEAATPSNWLRLVGSWEWVHADARGNGYTSFSALYDSNAFYFTLSFLLLMLAAIGSVLEYRKTWPFTLMLIGALFLIKGTAPPFGNFYSWFYHHLPGFKVFRNPYTKFGIALVPPLAILAGFGVDAICRRIPRGASYAVSIIAATAIVISIQPYWAGKMFKRAVYMQNYYVNVPSEYFEVANYLNEKADPRGRALVLPFSPNLSYTALDWNFVGPDPLRFLIERPTAFESNGYADPFVGIVYADINKSVNVLRRAADRADIHYVILHRDVVRNIYNADKFQDMEGLLASAGAVKVRDFGTRLTLYEFPAQKSSTQYSFIGLTEHLLKARNLPAAILYNLSDSHTVSDGFAQATAQERSSNSLTISSLPGVLGLTLNEKRQPIPGPVTSTQAALAYFYIDGQLFSSSIAGTLTPGTHEAFSLANVRFQNLDWENVDHVKGAPGSAIYRVAKIDILPGDHVYAMAFRAATAKLTLGMRVSCCFPRHDFSLTADAYPTLDGISRAVAFRISTKRGMRGSLCIFGDAAGLIAANPAKLIVATTQWPVTLHVPTVMGFTQNAAPLGTTRNSFFALDKHFDVQDSQQIARELQAAQKVNSRDASALVRRHPLYSPNRSTSAVAIIEGAPYRDRMQVAVPHGGILQFAAAFNDGWKATMAGQPLRKVVVDGVFNGWQIDHAGQVNIYFAPRLLLRVGAAISLLTLIGLLLLVWREIVLSRGNRDFIDSQTEPTTSASHPNTANASSSRTAR